MAVAAAGVYLYQVIPGQQRKPDVLHQFGHVLQTRGLVVLDPRNHGLKHLKDGDGRANANINACRRNSAPVAVKKKGRNLVETTV